MSAFGRAAGGMASLPCWNPDETILDVVLKGSFLTPELTSFSRHCLFVSAVLKDEKGIFMSSKI